MKHSHHIHVSSSGQDFSHAQRVKFHASWAVVVYFLGILFMWIFCSIHREYSHICMWNKTSYMAGKELLDTCWNSHIRPKLNMDLEQCIICFLFQSYLCVCERNICMYLFPNSLMIFVLSPEHISQYQYLLQLVMVCLVRIDRGKELLYVKI